MRLWQLDRMILKQSVVFEIVGSRELDLSIQASTQARSLSSH